MTTPPPALLAVAALALACGGPRPATQAATPAAGAPISADSTVRDSVPAARAAVPGAAQRSPAAALAGSWTLRAVEPGGRGPRLQLAIDSAGDSTFRVRVTFLMQGDVGIDPTRFEPTRGEIAPDGTIHLTIRIAGRAEPTGRLAGTLAEAGDTIRLETFQWSGTNQVAGDVHWVLVREP